MKNVFQAFLLLIARATDRELARQIQFLKVENRILRDCLPKRLLVTPRERQRLLRYGKPIGSAIRNVITIVTPRTFLRWVHVESPRRKRPMRKPGRPRTIEAIRDLIIRIALATGWGYTRVLGETKKLGTKFSRSTVVTVMKENGLDPGPKRGDGTWDDFIRRHAATLWACDFFSTRVWAIGGLVDCFVLFFIHVGSRRVFVSGITYNPDRPWMIQQARNVAMHFGEQRVAPAYLIRDMDSKFVPEFDEILEAEGVKVVRVGPRAPNLNAFAERFVLSIKSECLSHFVIFGEKHLRCLVASYLEHYLVERPHQGIGNVPLGGLPAAVDAAGEVECHERLGGLLKHFVRRAA